MKEVVTILRYRIMKIVQKIKKGHLGTSLSSLEAIQAIRNVMKKDDIFISSKGHDAVAQYVVLAAAGILEEPRLDTFRTEGGLPGHPTVDVPGIMANTGSLGMGLSKALGFAMGHPSRKVYVLLGDGEMMEGQNWEAAMAAGNAGLKNIVAVVDYNGFSQDDVTDLSSIKILTMFKAAGWKIRYVADGNNYWKVWNELERTDEGLHAIVLRTTKGKGTSFEGKWYSHFGPPGMEHTVSPQYQALCYSVRLLMEQDPKIILVGADTLRDLNLWSIKEHPDLGKRVYDFGVAEQNAVSFASARALMGEIPIVATYACFLRRAFEQIYNQVTEGTNVVYVGTMAGSLDPSGPGISHQSLDDKLYMSNLMLAKEPWIDEIYDTLLQGTKEKNSMYVRILA